MVTLLLMAMFMQDCNLPPSAPTCTMAAIKGRRLASQSVARQLPPVKNQLPANPPPQKPPVKPAPPSKPK